MNHFHCLANGKRKDCHVIIVLFTILNCGIGLKSIHIRRYTSLSMPENWQGALPHLGVPHDAPLPSSKVYLPIFVKLKFGNSAGWPRPLLAFHFEPFVYFGRLLFSDGLVINLNFIVQQECCNMLGHNFNVLHIVAKVGGPSPLLSSILYPVLVFLSS